MLNCYKMITFKIWYHTLYSKDKGGHSENLALCMYCGSYMHFPPCVCVCVCVCVCTRMLGCMQLFATLWTVAHETPLSTTKALLDLKE